MTYHIVLAATLSESGLKTLQSESDLQLSIIDQTAEALAPHLPTANAIITGSDLIIDAQTIANAPQLTIIARAGSALTNIDVEAATKHGIIVMNTPGVDAVTVAEYTFALMLALMRGVVAAHNSLQAGLWADGYRGNQLEGKTLGIIGYGRVGAEIALRAIAFGMDVLVSDPYVPESRVAGQRIKLVGTDELLRRADIITLHTSVVPDTEGLIQRDTIDQMKDGVYLVNVKHHSLIHPEDVIAALDSGKIAGVALDDFDTVSLADSPLLQHPKVIHTQKMRYNTVEAQHDLSSLLAPQLLDALREKDYRNAVNLPFMPGSEYERIQPHLDMAEKIGLLQHALGRKAAIEKIEISISGDEMIGMVKPLSVALLTGLLKPRLGGNINYINAPILAAEQGIIISQSKFLEIDSYPNLLTVRVIWADKGEMLFAGAVFNQTEPRIVQVDQYRTDFQPDGTLLIMGSFDVPGVIGKVGTFMSDHQINIAGWRTSREGKGGNTLSILSIDEPLNHLQLDELRTKDYVRHVTQIIFE